MSQTNRDEAERRLASLRARIRPRRKREPMSRTEAERRLQVLRAKIRSNRLRIEKLEEDG